MPRKRLVRQMAEPETLESLTVHGPAKGPCPKSDGHEQNEATRHLGLHGGLMVLGTTRKLDDESIMTTAIRMMLPVSHDNELNTSAYNGKDNIVVIMYSR